MLNLNASHFRLLERSLDVASLRQSVISNNIANAETPHFKRSEVVFESLLQQRMTDRSITGLRTDPRHIFIGKKSQNIKPLIQIDQNSVLNNNLNNVDLDYEMAELAKNQLRYNTLVNQVSHEIKMAKTALEARA